VQFSADEPSAHGRHPERRRFLGARLGRPSLLIFLHVIPNEAAHTLRLSAVGTDATRMKQIASPLLPVCAAAAKRDMREKK
jgi:hypothetical protein